jgi:hypothetical protein
MGPQPLRWSECGDENGDGIPNIHTTASIHTDQMITTNQTGSRYFTTMLVVARVDSGTSGTSVPGITCEACVDTVLSTMVVVVKPTV